MVQSAAMNKKQAAEYLGIKTRTLEYHQKQGRISVRYQRGATGDEAVYEESELRKLKAHLEKPSRGATSAVELEPSSDGAAQSLSPLRGSDAGVVAALSNSPALVALVQAVAAALPDRGDEEIYSLPEAAERSGVPVGHLRKAVREGKLKTVAIGGGFGKVKRSDLNQFVRELPERERDEKPKETKRPPAHLGKSRNKAT